MRVAIVDRFYPMPGGVTTLVEALAKEYDGKIDYEIITKKAEEKIPKVVSFPEKSTFKFYFKAFNYIRKNNFDVIHSHSSFISFFKLFLKPKIILTIHGYEKAFDAPSLKVKINENYIRGNLKVLAYRLAHVLVPTSTLLEEHLTGSYNISRKKIRIIPSVVDINFFKPLKVKKNKEVRIFQYSTSNRKGFNYLIKWTREMSKKGYDFKFVVVGGDKELIPKDIEKHFDSLGFVPFNKMPQVYNSCDIVILASLHDPFGLTPGEGMSCGKVAIITPYCGIKDYIKDGVNGFVCDFDKFPEKLELLIKDKKLREKMSSVARKAMMDNLSVQSVAKRYINLYEDVISNKNGRS